MQVELKRLIGTLNDTLRRTLEGAGGLCLSRTNYDVEIEHWLTKLLEITDGDVFRILKQFEVDPSRVAAELTRALDRFKTGNSRHPQLSPKLVEAIREGWVCASVQYGAPAVRSGHLLLALLSTFGHKESVLSSAPSLSQIDASVLKRDFLDITADSVESVAETAQAAASPAARGRAQGGDTPALDQYTINLTERAKEGQIDPVLGRDAEIRQMVDILMRRRQNNPILTGEAGVGKTAVVEGFAQRIVDGDVPPPLRQVSVRTLDLGLLQAGAGIKGEFENRLKSVINEVKASAQPVVLFIDEAHTMIGAGGGAGSGDAANLLKPALARGELRTIAATTWAEYKKYFEKDAALARRFQVVKVEEPDLESAVRMMRGLVPTLEKHHGVRILNEGIDAAVKLSGRYISGRQLPDKSVSILDTTCARIGLSQATTPPPVEDCRRRIDQTEISIGILGREIATGVDHQEKVDQLRQELDAAKDELKELEERWSQEKELVAKIKQLRGQLTGEEQVQPSTSSATAATADALPKEGHSEPAGDGRNETIEPLTEEQRQQLLGELDAATQQLKRIQGEQPLVHVCVDSQAIAETVEAWTGIPVGRMVADEIQTVLDLKQLMQESIVGQDLALERIAESIRTSRANLSDPRCPIGVFLMAGPSGVGKTESAITLANLLYGGEQNMTVINMSEFKEEHKVSLLMGSPPGYVGYGEGGVLTEAVRRKPYSVILLDEMEKAHPGVQDIFYQVFDKGTMKDGEGRDIDFKHTVIIMTTNAASEMISAICSDPETLPGPDAFVEAVFPELLKCFKPAFLGRLTTVPFYPLSDDVMKKIICLKLGKIEKRVVEHYGAKFSYSPELVDTIAARCTEVETGARNIDHILSRTILPELSAAMLARMAKSEEITRVSVTVAADGTFRYLLS